MKINIINPQMQTSVNIPVEVFTFSGGEQHVKLDAAMLIEHFHFGCRVVLEQDCRSAMDFMTIAMTKNAVDNVLQFIHHDVELIMLYVPYARQDRVCEPGEAFGVQVFGGMLNAMNFTRVIVADPHSEVTPAVVKNLFIIPQEEIAFHTLGWKLRMEDFALISPDGGALKKIYKLSKKMDLDVHCADKIRDTATGAIVRTEISVQDFDGRNLMIVDDICDGGRTFIELAKLLKERNAGKVELYVTHGIFSKGVNVLGEHIDCIHSFNVWDNNVDQYPQDLLVRNQAVLQGQILADNIWKMTK